MLKNELSGGEKVDYRLKDETSAKYNNTVDNSKTQTSGQFTFPFSAKRPEQDHSAPNLSQEVYDEFIQLRSEFLEHRDSYDNQACVNIGIQMNASAILLTEVYDYDPQYYYEALILTTSAYRKSKNYEVAEHNLKKMKNGLKKLIETQKQDNQVLYNYYIMCLKEFVVLYTSMQNYHLAVKYEELLLGEDQEFFQEEDTVELKLAKGMILKTSHKFDEAIELLEGVKQGNIDSLSSFLAVSLLLELSSLYNAKGNIESAVYEINTVLDILKGTGLANAKTKQAFIEAYTVKINYLADFVKKFEINNQDSHFDEEASELRDDINKSYMELVSFILSELRAKDILLEENLFINPIHRYILYLGKTKEFKVAINLCDEALTVLKRFYSNFNRHIGYTYELKARLLSKKQEINKAKENYQAAYDIFFNLNDRGKSVQMKKNIDKLTKN